MSYIPKIYFPQEESGGNHSPVLMNLLAEELCIKVEDIRDFELTLTDTQPGQTWGVRSTR